MNQTSINPPQCAANTFNSSTASPQSSFGNLYVRRRAEKSYFGYDPSVLKSSIQKYARRNEVEKGLWCLVEMDLFSLLEWNGEELNDFLTEYPDEKHAKVQIKAKSLRSNMINRLVVMMSEEVSISAWWMPAIMFDLHQKWVKNRGNASSRKFLVDMYLYLTSQKMIRLISDLKSVFLLAPHYLKPEKRGDLLQIHKSIQKRYPNIYSNQDNVGKITWDLDMRRKGGQVSY